MDERKEMSPEKAAASAIQSNLRTVESYLQDVPAGRPTGNIEYHLDFVKSRIDRFPSIGAPYQSQYEILTRRASEVIGNKVRGSDSVYE